MNKRGEVKATAIIIIALVLLGLVQRYRMNSDRIDAINQSREFCLEQAHSLPITWNEDFGQCRLIDRVGDKPIPISTTIVFIEGE